MHENDCQIDFPPIQSSSRLFLPVQRAFPDAGDGSTQVKLCEEILHSCKNVDPATWQVGITKVEPLELAPHATLLHRELTLSYWYGQVFLKQDASLQLEQAKLSNLDYRATVIQAEWKRHVCQKRYKLLRQTTIFLQAEVRCVLWRLLFNRIRKANLLLQVRLSYA